MKHSANHWSIVYLLLLLEFSSVRAHDDLYEYPGISATTILRARGYQAEEHYIVTEDGYRLQLVHAWNPQCTTQENNQTVPIVFFHGILSQANVFVINSFRVRPRDFRSFDLNNKTEMDIIVQDPSSRSLPLLAMNFGHHVWLLNRRGAPGSQMKIDLNQTETDAKLLRNITLPPATGPLSSLPAGLLANGQLLQQIPFSFNPDFWSFSIDEQAELDFPQVVNYVSEQSNGRKVAVVGHSEGGAIVLMSLAEQPELANNISFAILWSPAFSLGVSESGYMFEISSFKPILESLRISLPLSFTSTQIQAIYAVFCSTSLARTSSLCRNNDQEIMYPELFSSMYYSSSSHEIAQLLQNGNNFGGVMHKYDYGSSEKNLAKYGQSVPPVYNASRITLDRISFYAAGADSEVTPQDVRNAASMLNVPYEFNLINRTFSHNGYFINRETAQLAIIPTFKDIQRFSSG